MIFNEHSRLAGKHALLSASKYHWINYNDDKLLTYLRTYEAAARGTRLHALAHACIKERVKLAGNGTTLSMYVNDAIGYKMESERVLYVSDNCFGTPDTIAFRRGKLRIHDLKTGTNPASEHQLEVYAAMFCLEYRMKPYEIEIELRIYQNDDRVIFDADPEVIARIMDKIQVFDRLITAAREEELA
jgi:hypothetical protein